MTSENEKPQKFGLTFKELSERSTVYRDNLMKGHSVMITGAGSGIGKAMAFLYARLGANVSICGRTEEKLKNVATELEDRCGKEIFWKVSNVRNPEEMESFLDEITDKFGKIDTVINNAGGQFVQDAIDFRNQTELFYTITNVSGAVSAGIWGYTLYNYGKEKYLKEEIGLNE